MEVFLKKGFDFIPKWLDNDKAEKPGVVHFKFLSGADFTSVVKEDGKTDNEKEWEIICTGVDNMKVNGKDITPLDIYKMDALVDLYIELKLAYRLETYIDKKKQ